VQTPLIVAVEPDQRQAAQLSSMFSRQFSAELVVDRSAKSALARLEGRVPALVLISALIPPKDEAMLVRWLRELGSAASHVQTVTIPVLACEEPQTRRRGGALSFGRERPPAAPDSCDPAVFADWISIYLHLASAHRADTL
jgi:CheY-like chemotaxis protein